MVKVKLKEIMVKKGINQMKLSELTGIKQGTLSEIVRNRRDSINKIHLYKIMKALDIRSFDEILELE